MDNFVDNVDNFYSVEVNCYKIVTFVTKYIHNLLNCQTIYDAICFYHDRQIGCIYDAFYKIRTFCFRNFGLYLTHLVLKTVSNIVLLVIVFMGATVFPHFSVGRVSVFLHFTEIYRTLVQAKADETKIS